MSDACTTLLASDVYSVVEGNLLLVWKRSHRDGAGLVVAVDT